MARSNPWDAGAFEFGVLRWWWFGTDSDARSDAHADAESNADTGFNAGAPCIGNTDACAGIWRACGGFRIQREFGDNGSRRVRKRQYRNDRRCDQDNWPIRLWRRTEL